MIDPSRLEASARGVYGDEAFDAMYGTLRPVPEHRVITMEDGQSLSVGNRPLLFMDTPGHARHHFCIWDERTKGWFTGDTFGVSYRDFDTQNGHFIFPTTTPIQFDPPALITSIDRMLEQSPEYMYLTHFGRVRNVSKMACRIKAGVQQLVEIAETHVADDDRTQSIQTAIMDWLYTGARDHGVTLPEMRVREILQIDVFLNTQGVEFWLDHRE